MGQAVVRHRHGPRMVEDQNRIRHAWFMPDLRLPGQADRPRPNIRRGIGPPVAPMFRRLGTLVMAVELANIYTVN